MRRTTFDWVALGLFAALLGPPLAWIGVEVLRGLALSVVHGELPWEARGLVLLARSVAIGIGSAALALAFGVPYALLTARTDLRGRRVWALLGLLPLAMPPYASAIGWFHFLGRTGPVADMLKLAGAPGFAPPGAGPGPASRLWAAIWVLGTLLWPAAAFLAARALEAVPPELEEEARTSTSHLRALRAAAVPYLRPALAAGALLVGLLAAADFGVPATFSLPVYSVDLQSEFAAARDYAHAWALAAPYWIGVLPLVLLQRQLLNATPIAGAGGGEVRLTPLRLGRGTAAAHLYCAALLALTVGIPLGVLLQSAGGAAVYPRVLSDAAEPILTSLGSGCAAAAAATLLGFAVAFALETRPAWPRAVRAGLEMTALLPYALPGVLLGIALIACLNHPGPTGWLYDSPWVLPFAYTILFFPFAFKSVQAGLKTLDPGLMEAAALDGAPRVALLLRVAAPALRGSLGVAATLVFLLAARELDATSLLRPPGVDSLGFRIHDLFHYGTTYRDVGALCVLATVGGASIAALGLRVALGTQQE